MKYLWYALWLLSIQMSIAQDCSKTFHGKVLDFHNGTPLEGAIIRFENASIQTDKEGNFSIQKSCKTSYTLTITHNLCEPLTKTITLLDHDTTIHSFYLEHHLDELEVVTVSGHQKKKTHTAQETTLSKTTIDQHSHHSLGQLLTQITGVTALQTGASIAKPVIQGLNGSRVIVMNNGVRMQDMEWGEEHAPNVDINTAGHITVIKGAAALRHGSDALGGVILMEPRAIPALDTLYGKTILTGATNGRGGTLTTELNKGYDTGWFFKIQGTLKRFGDQETPDYVLSNTGISEQGGAFSFGKKSFEQGWDAYYSYYANKIGILRASHIGNIDDLITAINTQQPNVVNDFTYTIQAPKQEVTHHLGRLRYYKRFEAFGKWTIQYDFQQNKRLEFDIRRTAALSEIPGVDLKLTTHTLNSDLTMDAHADYTIDTGVMVRYQDHFANPSTGIRRLIPDYTKYDAGAFVTLTYDLNDQLIWDTGLRYDFSRIDAKKFYLSNRWESEGYDQNFSDIVQGVFGTQLLTNPVFNYHSIAATTGLNYTFKERYEFRANYALSQRPPNPAELFSDGLHHSAARIELGDLNIGKETSHKLSLSLQRNHKTWGWEVAPYINYIKDYIQIVPDGVQLTIRGAFPIWQYQQTDVRLLGLDAKTHIQWHSHWKTDHEFSILKGTDRKENIPLINISAAHLKNSITYTVKKWHDFSASLSSAYTFEQNEYPDNLSVFSPEQSQEVALEINTPPEGYHLWNANVQMTFPMWKRSTLHANVTATNILNTTYRNYLNRQRYFADEMGRSIEFTLIFKY